MITFVCCLIALIVGYFIYGKFIERIFGIDAKRQTPAYTHQDGVDYIPMPTWKVFMIQFLNIAGLGPIFGAIMGAKFGTASFLWIVLGSIFAGSVHDYLSGMLSLRHNGESLPEIIGRYLGVNFKQFMRGFTVILMVLVGSVFVAGPAGLLAKLTPEHLDTTFWIIVVFLYYILATLLPVDKIIGKIYPLFAAALLFMAIGILVMLFVNHPPLPEITDGMPNTYPGHLPIFPIMFVSIACGAISGFHATQSPLMARCIKNEKYGRPIFFGSMICIPLFLVAIALLLYSQKDKDGFDMIWRYFAWSNQTLAVFTLWALTVYLVISKKPYIVTLIPALFMTAVCSTYIFVAPEGLGMENGISQIIGFAITIVVLAFFLVWKKKTGNI